MDPEFLRDLFAPIGEIAVRRMFGGQGIYRDGLMFALVADGELYLKTDADSAPRFDAAGSAPFTFIRAGKPMQTSYRRLPEAAFDDPEELKDWAELAIATAVRAKKPAPRRKARG